jgi:hypothetical protein
LVATEHRRSELDQSSVAGPLGGLHQHLNGTLRASTHRLFHGLFGHSRDVSLAALHQFDERGTRPCISGQHLDG